MKPHGAGALPHAGVSHLCLSLFSCQQLLESPEMSREEQETFVVFFSTFELGKKLDNFADLYDGRALFEVMSFTDSGHFKNTGGRATSSTASPADNWVLKMNTMKRLYRLLMSYSLPSPHPSLSKSSLREPDFSSIGKGNNKPGLLQVCRMCLVAGVWGPSNAQVIGKIQSLTETQQRILMTVIEDVMATLPASSAPSISNSSSETSDLAELASGSKQESAKQDRLAKQNDELRARCEKLQDEVEQMQTALEDAQSEKADALAQLASAKADTAIGLRSSQSESGQTELLVLREELGKTEEALGSTEADLEKQTALVEELSKTVEDLKVQARDSARLRDQLDEHRYTAERLKKSENVIEKYRKKLEDTAELRRELKSSEEHNARLTNANGTLEAECKRLGTHKVLIDTYKSQIEQLERKTDEQAQEVSELTVALETAQSQLETLIADSERDKEELQLIQDRVRELEQGARENPRTTSSGDLQGSLGDELQGDGADSDDLEAATKADLKLRVRGLTKDLESARAASAGKERVMVLEALLADAKIAKERYQKDYLDAHREKLVLQASLDAVSAGKSDATDAQTSIALRQRLNETVDELDSFRKEHSEVQVRSEALEKELVVAKSDLNLVGKDQLDVLKALRAEASTEAAGLKEKAVSLATELADAKGRITMQLEQINGLLLEKIDRAADDGDLATETDSQQRVLALQADNTRLSEQIRHLEEKLAKARNFIKEQNLLLKQQTTSGPSDGSSAALKSTIGDLQEELVKTKRATQLLEQRYKLEQQLMLTAWHDVNSRTIGQHLAHASIKRNQPKPAPTSWLTQQRAKVGSAIFVAAEMTSLLSHNVESELLSQRVASFAGAPLCLMFGVAPSY